MYINPLLTMLYADKWNAFVKSIPTKNADFFPELLDLIHDAVWIDAEPYKLVPEWLTMIKAVREEMENAYSDTDRQNYLLPVLLKEAKENIDPFCSIDLYYNDLSTDTPYVVKLHNHDDFYIHFRSGSFDTSLEMLRQYIQERLGKTI